MKALDLNRQRFGRFLVLARGPNTSRGQTQWLCRCDCGTERLVRGVDLRSGKSRSCGCLQREIAQVGGRERGMAAAHAAITKHGHAKKGQQHPLYTTWRGMIDRCTRPSCPNFYRYGGRGIRICDRWRNNFAAFLADIGPRPSPRHTLDRIDNDGNYEPRNVRWATREEQMGNQQPRSHLDRAASTRRGWVTRRKATT